MLGESDRSQNVVRWENYDDDDDDDANNAVTARAAISIPPPFNVESHDGTTAANFQHPRLGHTTSNHDDLLSHWPNEGIRFIEDDISAFDIDRLDRGVSFNNSSPLHASTGYTNFNASHAPLQQTHSRWDHLWIKNRKQFIVNMMMTSWSPSPCVFLSSCENFFFCC